ncbi:MAG: TonB-dependent receptor plug domain-containing protein [Alphaproteobacteria bacterium]
MVVTRKFKKNILISSTALTAFLSYVPTASSQTIDYGSLEALFGEAVTTSATGQPQRSSEVPLTMEILTAEDIRKSGAKDIPDAIRNVPGVSVWRFARDQAEVSIRGYNQPYSPKLLVLVNGKQVYMDDFGYTVWETLPVQMSEIRQIEIVKGPNTALFGFNALAGVINIITYNPLYDDVSNAGVTVGNDNYRSASGAHTMKVSDKLHMRLSGGAARSKEFKNTTSVFSEPQKGKVNLDSIFKINDKQHVRFEASRAFNDRNEYTPTFATYHSQYAITSAKATYASDSSIGFLNATVYRNHMDKNITTTTSGIVTVRNTLTVAQIEDTFSIGTDHRFRIQGEFRDTVVKSDEYWGADAKLGFNTYAMSGMWNWKINPKLEFTNALRGEHLRLKRSGLETGGLYNKNGFFDKRLTEFSYNSSLVWNPDHQNTLRLMTSRGIQPPALVDFGFYLPLPAFGILYTGNPNQTSTILTSYEIGYERQIEKINGKAFANLFFQQTQDIKYLGATQTGTTLHGNNIGHSKTYGIELGARGKIGTNWNWDASYLYQDVDDNLDFGESTDYDGEEWTPQNTIKAHIGYEKDNWEADLYGVYVSSYKMNEPVTFSTADTLSGDAISVSANLGYNFDNGLKLSISGQELGHQATQQTSGLKAERRVFLSVSKDF